MLTFGSLFAGIGGFDLGLERAGMECAWQVEIDLFCQNVLAKHWPDVTRYGDVRDVGHHNLEAVDLICGGFPCQPHSVAGKRRGAADDRDLWPEYRRVVAELRPRWVVAENVPGIRHTILDQVLSDLEGLDYTTGTLVVPACAFDAPHRRERVFIVAHSECAEWRQGQSSGDVTDWPDARWQEEAARTRTSGADGHEGVVADAGQFDGQRTSAIRQKRGRYVGIRSDARFWRPEPDVGRVVARFPPWLDDSGGIDHDEVLRAMRKVDGASTLEQRKARQHVSGAPLLLQSLLWRLDCGTEQVAHQGCVQEALTKGIPNHEGVQQLRRDRESAKAPRELQRCVICGDSLSAMPHGEGGCFATMGPSSQRISRLRALGNAVVPQVAEWIGRRIVEAH